MQNKEYRCKNCGNSFEIKGVITREEALEKKIALQPIRCPKCGSQDIIEK